jgi:pyridoxine kinase
MKQLLSIQSSVAVGFVGNTVAGPVLTALGQHPLLVDTVLLAAHPGYGKRAGGAVPADILDAVLEGVLALGDATLIDIVISGYLGSAQQIDSIVTLLDAWRDQGGGSYILDPVLGDGGRLYVAPDIASAMVSELLPRADIVTPNHYELTYLSGCAVTNLTEAVAAATLLIERHGLQAVIATGVVDGIDDEGSGATGDLLVGQDGEPIWQPSDASGKNVAGGGDLLTSLFAGLLSLGHTLPDAFVDASKTAQAVIAASPDGRDLALLDALDDVARLAS